MTSCSSNWYLCPSITSWWALAISDVPFLQRPDPKRSINTTLGLNLPTCHLFGPVPAANTAPRPSARAALGAGGDSSAPAAGHSELLRCAAAAPRSVPIHAVCAVSPSVTDAVCAVSPNAPVVELPADGRAENVAGPARRDAPAWRQRRHQAKAVSSTRRQRRHEAKAVSWPRRQRRHEAKAVS